LEDPKPRYKIKRFALTNSSLAIISDEMNPF